MGHATSVRQALVRETATLLLGSGHLLQTFWSERSGRAPSQRDRSIAGDFGNGLARVAHLRRRNRALAVASASDNGRRDGLFARRGDRYAVQRHAHDRHGLRRGAPAPPFGVRRLAAAFTRQSRPYQVGGTTGSLCREHTASDAALRQYFLASGDSLRFLSRPSGARKGTRRDNPLRRRGLFLGALYQTLARCAAPSSSRRNHRVLRDSAALVHPLRPPQPRLLPHLHHRTQLQALPNSRIPAHPTLLVLHSGRIRLDFSVVLLCHACFS